jgi:peptide/nickel transport system ATP-binding protein
MHLIQEEELSSKGHVPEKEVLLRVSGLSISFITRSGKVQAVNDVSFEIKRGESFGLVGETGCGKSQTALAIMRLTPDSGIIERGEVWFDGKNLTENIAREFKLVPKNRKGDGYKLVRNKTELNRMNSEMSEIRGKDCSMIFQEPMTSLNPVYNIGRQVSEVLITHSIQSVAGRILAKSTAGSQNLAKIADYVSSRQHISRSELQEFLKGLNLEDLGDQIWFIMGRKDIGIAQKKDAILSLGNVHLSALTLRYLREVRNSGNSIPVSYKLLNRVPILNRWLIGELRKEALAISYELLSLVNMPNARSVLTQYPHELSGGMRQRVMVAMAIAAKPKLIIADEPTSALDVTVQAQILELLRDMKETFGTSLLFISHDMGVIAEICDRIGVMYAGDVVETAKIADLFENPEHPYTRGLLQAIPKFGGKREALQTIKGELPNLIDPPTGCRFHTRCPYVFGKCTTRPPLITTSSHHNVLCWLFEESEDYGK